MWRRGLLALCFVLAACAPPGPSAPPDSGGPKAAEQVTPGGELTFIVGAEPPSFDGHRETSFAMLHWTAPHYSLLVRQDPEKLPSVVPNVTAPYLIILTALLGQAILLEASLSFLGLGVAEPTPAWGLMLRGAGVQFAERAPWLAIVPGVAISLTVFAFNLLGDSLRDALDHRLRVG
jgi:hypothetical protein